MSRLKRLVLWKSVLLTTLCSVALLGLWWWGLVHTVVTQGRTRAQQSLNQMQQTLTLEFSRAEQTGLAFGSWWSREGGALDSPESLQKVIPFLENGAIITNLLLSRVDGDSACVVRREGQWNLVLYRGGRNPKRYLVQDGQWVPNPLSIDDQATYDARERHWYRFGAAQTKASWTLEAYPYYASPVAGFTFAVPIRSPQGALEGVIGVDVSLGELSQLLWAHQPTPETRVIVTDRSGRLLVPPQIPAMPQSSNGFAYQLRPLPPGLLHGLLHGQITEPAGELPPLIDPAKSYVSCTGAFSSQGRPSMELHIAIPKDDLFPGQRWYAAFTLVLALLAVVGVAWTLFDLHKRVMRPMRQLAEGLDQPAGQVAESMDFNSDIWELQRVGEKLQLAGRTDQQMRLLMHRVEHSQRVDSIGAMAPGIVHDVTNQLTMVLGQISICRTILDAHPELQPYLHAAEGATVKCAEVLRALMDYSRPNQDQRELLSLNLVVEGAVSLLRQVLGSSIQVELDLGRDLPTLYGEPIKLQQVLVNLGLNARDAMPEGGHLLFRTYPQKNSLCLEVSDTGSGMSEEVRQRLFEPFFTTKDPDKGTGLGLAMVANIISAHGGRIVVTSEPGQGTCFQITFPPSLRKRGEQVMDPDSFLG